MNEGKDLDKVAVRRAVRAVRSFGNPRTISLTGGEPLCHPDFYEILEYISSTGPAPRINTNCTLIDSKVAHMLAEHNVSQVTVSVDSLEESVNAFLGRGSDYIARLLSALENLRNAGIQFFVKCTVNHDNVRQVKSIMEWAHKEGAIGFAMGRTIPVGRGGHRMHDYLLDWNEYRSSCHACSTDIPGGFKFLIDDPLKHVLDQRIQAVLTANTSRSRKLLGGCMAGLNMLYILPNGDVLPCPVLPVVIGNIYHEDLEEMWSSSDVLGRLRCRSQLKGRCGRCDKRYICGGCRGAALAFHGDYMATDPACPAAVAERLRRATA